VLDAPPTQARLERRRGKTDGQVAARSADFGSVYAMFGTAIILTYMRKKWAC
jgi:hypothetical protein